MRLQFKHQKFQADAAQAVCDVFAGQQKHQSTYLIDQGTGLQQRMLGEDLDFMGTRNEPIAPELTDQVILRQLNKIQRGNQIEPSKKLEGHYNLTIEMETGVGKTYTYIKTMYELNKRYGWCKFIVVVPSVAIREGVYKSFEVTQDHFAEEYGKKIRFFIYNSARLSEIDHFASDSAINVMIINSQAFNAKGKDARRISMQLDEFRSRCPMDVIAKTNPILIIDEPQSVEGKQTKDKLKEFNPLMTLRYSATHRSDSIYNMVYRLDAVEAYNKHLVKKIAVKGISQHGSTGTESYLYLERINLSEKNPTATLHFECKGANSIRRVNRTIAIGYNLYDHSGRMEEYQNNFVVTDIDGRDSSVTFLNGIKLYAGDVMGEIEEAQLRRLQIRETILSHIDCERQLFKKGIKVLSLFFIDEVAKYRQYDTGHAANGPYADIFEEEYREIISSMQEEFGEEAYRRYLSDITAHETHQGYFSADKKGDTALDSKRGKASDDASAYDLIMKNKERLLDRNEPVRFIFSHSALREGWDNPNVFQICTLKQSGSDVRKRQEVGRGLRLCVNQDGERMDSNLIGGDVHRINVLTVIASESYDDFAKALQGELAEAVANRPCKVSAELFVNKTIKDQAGNEMIIDGKLAQTIFYRLIVDDYADLNGKLTEKFYDDKANNCVKFPQEVQDYALDLMEILDKIYDNHTMVPENARANDVELRINQDKLAMPEFKELWKRINRKSVYVVDFDTDELVNKAIRSLDSNLRVSPIYFSVESGHLGYIKSKDDLQMGSAFTKSSTANHAKQKITVNSNVKYDLIGKLVDETGLTRSSIVEILKGITKVVFDQFKENPEEFIQKAAALINDEKATAIIQHITYNVLDEQYETDVFADVNMKGQLEVNAIKADKHLYDHVLFDSTNERRFATNLDTCKDVAVYVKLPNRFFITTPVGNYNPDWAIAFYQGNVKHIYFIAETKGSLSSMQLRSIEESKIHCAREHFKAISGDNVVYDVIDSYDTLIKRVLK